MSVKYLNKTFLEIKASGIALHEELKQDIFIFLPLNAKMVKIRGKGQYFDPATIELYLKYGHREFYALDASANQATDSSDSPERKPSIYAAEELASPKISSLEQASGAKSIGGNSSQDSDVNGAKPEPAAGNADAPEKSPSKADSGMPLSSLDGHLEAAVPETNSGKGPLEFGENEEENRHPGEVHPDDSEQIAAEHTPDSIEEQSFSADKEAPEAEARFSAQKRVTDSNRKISGAWNQEQAGNLVINGDRPDVEENRRISGTRSPEENDEIAKFSADPIQRKDERTVKITSDIVEMEDQLWKGSTDGEKFVEELRQISAGKDEESKNSKWKTTLDDNSSRLRGLEKHDAAAVKLSHALSKRLTHLRSELNHSMSKNPDAKNTREQLNSRVGELRERILEIENLAVLIEAMDDPDFDTSNLPEPLDKKDKNELIRFAEKKISGIRNSTLLSDPDFFLVQKKIQFLKAKEFGVFAENIGALSEKLTQRLAQIQETGADLDGKQKQELNEEILREVQTVKTSANISKSLSKLRQRLASLLDMKPTNFADRTAVEDEAAKIQTGIRELENLAMAIDSGEKIDPKKLALFADRSGQNPDAEFSLQDSESSVAGITRLLGSLGALKESVIATKMETEDLASDLLEKINGVHLKNPDEPGNSLNGKFSKKIEKISQELTQLLPEAEKTGAPMEEMERIALNKKIVDEIKLVKSDQNISRNLENLRRRLADLMDSNPKNVEEKLAVATEASQLKEQIHTLEKIARAVENGTGIDAAILAGHMTDSEAAAVENEYSVGESETAVSGIGHLLDSLGKLKESLAETKTKAANAAQDLRKKLNSNGNKLPEFRISSDSEADAVMNSLVSGSGGKMLQACVYAATIFRGFGYNDKALEHDLLLTCYLHDYLEEQIKGKCSERVENLHRLLHQSSEEAGMLLRDLSQAIRMGREYNSIPTVVTGKFAIDPNIFSEYCQSLCTQLDSEIDYQLVERARQTVQSGMAQFERESLISIAHKVSRELSGIIAKSS